MRKVSNSILHCSPKDAPEGVEIRNVEAALESAPSSAEAGIKVCLKGILVMQVMLLSVAVLSLGGVPPRSLIPLELIITREGRVRTRGVPRWAQKAFTGLAQMC